MRRELLLLEEMIDAAEQARLLASGQTAESLTADRRRRRRSAMDRREPPGAGDDRVSVVPSGLVSGHVGHPEPSSEHDQHLRA